MTTNVPKPSFGPNGFVAPAEPDILDGVLADLNAAFGGNLNTALETPQGQLASSLAALVGNCNDKFVEITNQVDPALATGRMQDAIARIYFLERDPAEPTTVDAVCSGLPGTVIPAGALAKATTGDVYSCTAGGTIPVGGSLTLPFACTTAGPIVLPANSLTTIYRAIPGWDTVTNPAGGVVGRDVESPAQFEQRRAASVALNAAGTLAAIRATVLNVPGVLDVYATENPTSSAVTIGGVSIAKNSLYVAVAGGAAADIAKAIWRKKAPGCGMVGTTTVTVADDVSGYSLPYPTYSIKFTVPTALPILFAVSIQNSAAVPADATVQIQNALLAAFAGVDGGSRGGRIGGTLYASRFYAAVTNLGPWAQLISILIGTSTATLYELTANINQIPTLSASDIAVTLV